jgi:hypothetical protein
MRLFVWLLIGSLLLQLCLFGVAATFHPAGQLRFSRFSRPSGLRWRLAESIQRGSCLLLQGQPLWPSFMRSLRGPQCVSG